MTRALVFDAVRLPRGRVRRGGGTLAQIPPHALFAQLLAALERRGLQAAEVDDIVVGISTVTGEQAGNLARAAALSAGWPDAVGGAVVSRLCCSGIEAIGTAAAKVVAGQADIVVAGGVESMSRVPMLSDAPAIATDDDLGERTGFVTIGVSADATAAAFGFTRDQLDEYAAQSHRRAAAAPPSGAVVPVTLSGEVILAADEGARPDATAEQFAELPALFGDDPAWERVLRRLPELTKPERGLHSIATAPQLADGASAAVIASPDAADGRLRGREPVAEILAVTHRSVRSPLLSAPVDAARDALRRAGIGAGDLDLVEANESFAVSPLLLTRELGLDPTRVNPNGGALAVGHPLGATGGNLLVSALDGLRRVDGEHALVTIPAALGLGSALVLRRLR
ncbi:thiolase family protein [Prescottella agglutinans]|uniref:Acetyl-CoA C-acetyltransferase n=1 Tax=Prescottella agglutinans TaxID=1644129 RepID=A0ABT6M959_9NOCA|nr:thiolase family protein [Prescottella agglutinans]MDH6280843.1 acetyl-CoA C-acetyltransferase [Prescottella agglutinans]